MTGSVYIYTLSSVPKHVKIGYTERDPHVRAKELNSTGLPGEYQVKYVVVIANPRAVEREAHTILASMRFDKEWFQCSVDQARAAIDEAVRRVGQESSLSSWDHVDNGSPLVPGHPLRDFYESESGRLEGQDLFGARFTVDPDPEERRPVSGTMEYTCRYCQHVSDVPSAHVVRCPHCRKTHVLY